MDTFHSTTFFLYQTTDTPLHQETFTTDHFNCLSRCYCSHSGYLRSLRPQIHSVPNVFHLFKILQPFSSHHTTNSNINTATLSFSLNHTNQKILPFFGKGTWHLHSFTINLNLTSHFYLHYWTHEPVLHILLRGSQVPITLFTISSIPKSNSVLYFTHC